MHILINNDLEFVTPFPCLLGHPVCQQFHTELERRSNLCAFTALDRLWGPEPPLVLIWPTNLMKANLSVYVLEIQYLVEQWSNLKDLSGGLNLSRGLNMVGST